jgi:hypothetical protein
MKGLMATALAMTGLIGVVAVSTVHAQLVERLRFTTSFPFTIGNTNFPAGSYLIGPADDNNDGVLRVSGGRLAAFMTVIPDGVKANEPKDNELTFERLGDHYVLAQIWDASEQTATEPAQFAAELRHEQPRNKVAERITVPFIKVS